MHFILGLYFLYVQPSKWDLPPPLAWALGIRHLGSYSTNDQFREAVRYTFKNFALEFRFIN